MRRQGQRPSPLTEEEKQLIKAFLENDMSYDEYAEKVGLTKPQLRYRVAKYKKELTDNEQTNQTD